ncbi:hypothetical protein QP027_11195 [Corynebacterium breve]|uniref:Uncharacterized protein n=1 Tax=Corynebacterium breve TaxID=3049799 RepID=A0ABY8VDQ2_9CORY|nr:hypothetical protein [Corynebacterium breve]WIM67633.1 hypothetical protein QP027_11195 [Corynebacterium breve]
MTTERDDMLAMSPLDQLAAGFPRLAPLIAAASLDSYAVVPEPSRSAAVEQLSSVLGPVLNGVASQGMLIDDPASHPAMWTFVRDFAEAIPSLVELLHSTGLMELQGSELILTSSGESARRNPAELFDVICSAMPLTFNSTEHMEATIESLCALVGTSQAATLLGTSTAQFDEAYRSLILDTTDAAPTHATQLNRDVRDLLGLVQHNAFVPGATSLTSVGKTIVGHALSQF